MLAVNPNAAGAFIAPSSFPKLSCDNGIILKGYDYHLSRYQQSLFAGLNIPFPDSLSRAVAKRQSEYLAGRYAAIAALAELGVATRNIPTGEHRSPVWPKSILASITHTGTTAFCAAASKEQVKYLGIDHENWLTPASVDQVKASIVNDREEQLLKQAAMPFEHAFTLVFSAKESLFKALYPAVGYYFDFFAAEIITLHAPQKSFVLQLTQDLAPTLTAGINFTGRFLFNESAVQTLIFEPC